MSDETFDLTVVEATFEDMLLRVDETEGDGRTLEGVIVPWDRPAQVLRPIKGIELFRRGALTKTLRDRTTPIPLLGLHAENGPVGKLVDSHDDEVGQHAVFRLFNTAAARDAAELVREGIWTGLSVGGTGIPARTKVTHQTDGSKLVERFEIRLDHVGLVRTPAYADARVLALRAEEDEAEAPVVDVAALVAARRARRAHLVGR